MKEIMGVGIYIYFQSKPVEIPCFLLLRFSSFFVFLFCLNIWDVLSLHVRRVYEQGIIIQPVAWASTIVLLLLLAGGQTLF